jgi:tetratricopeptide (TPR) repeat protein
VFDPLSDRARAQISAEAQEFSGRRTLRRRRLLPSQTRNRNKSYRPTHRNNSSATGCRRTSRRIAWTKGNEARDSKKFADAETAYKEVLKLKPRDARAAYGLGNVYSDQQRWDEAEAAYRNSVRGLRRMRMPTWR